MDIVIVTALFSIAGTVVGVVLTTIGNIKLSEKELRLRLIEKVLDRRIEAHNTIIEISKSMRTMRGLGREDQEGQLARFPDFMASIREFIAWFVSFSEKFSKSSPWVSLDVTKELNLIQDYLVNLELATKTANDNQLTEIGNIIRQDFVDFSTSIERIAYAFFNKDLQKLLVNDFNEQGKYEIDETMRRLSTTRLMTQSVEIAAILNRN